ncbi:MAG: Alpha/Beta hydrolase protein [Monoraphidium minutum]|nr:MAG: Alpha/Beta hydrolase protein [Monoraphidium minutum]
MAGRARGARALGRPEPVLGLANPDVPSSALNNLTASMEDLVLPFGYPLESWPVETADGFVLRLYRIPYGAKNATTRDASKPVVLLMHGMTMASSAFVVLDPESSMGFYLADAGYDVWIANTRCNTYGQGNRLYRNTDAGFWQNSIDDLALSDLPAIIDKVLRFTGQRSLSLVGHSQGAMLGVMLLAQQPEFNEKLMLCLCLGAIRPRGAAPARPAPTPPSPRANPAAPVPHMISDAGVGHYLPASMTSHLLKGCAAGASASAFCFDLVDFLFFGPENHVATADFPRLAAVWPSGMPLRVLLHWAQMCRNGRGPEMYDFGTDCGSERTAAHQYRETCNQARYGQDAPPRYDLSQVKTTAAVLYGDIDQMGSPRNVEKLLGSWGAQVVFEKQYATTGHMDFLWARGPAVLKRDVLRILGEHAPRPPAAAPK